MPAATNYPPTASAAVVAYHQALTERTLSEPAAGENATIRPASGTATGPGGRRD